ncbi:hypothetical protein ACTXT7_015792 [Hymenolepis weldensis]
MEMDMDMDMDMGTENNTRKRIISQINNTDISVLPLLYYSLSKWLQVYMITTDLELPSKLRELDPGITLMHNVQRAISAKSHSQDSAKKAMQLAVIKKVSCPKASPHLSETIEN